MFFIRFCTLLPNHPLLNTILVMSVLQSNTYSHSLLPISVLNTCMSGCFRQGDGEDNLFQDKKKYLDLKLGINGTQGLSSPTKDLKFGHSLLTPIFGWLGKPGCFPLTDPQTEASIQLPGDKDRRSTGAVNRYGNYFGATETLCNYIVRSSDGCITH